MINIINTDIHNSYNLSTYCGNEKIANSALHIKLLLKIKTENPDTSPVTRTLNSDDLKQQAKYFLLPKWQRGRFDDLYIKDLFLGDFSLRKLKVRVKKETLSEIEKSLIHLVCFISNPYKHRRVEIFRELSNSTH